MSLHKVLDTNYTLSYSRGRYVYITVKLFFFVCKGVKEVTLLGQNVNSYRDLSEQTFSSGSSGHNDSGEGNQVYSEGFSSVYKPRHGGKKFSALLDKVSLVDPEMRIRFTSPHPKDFPDEVKQTFSRLMKH